jgi:tRNA (guanosine-2'-O-)-methyltransferase
MTPERYEKLIKVLHHRQPNLTVVMENVLDPHNVSAVLRTCEAVGIQDVYVLTSRIPKYERFGPRSSSSAMKWVTVHEYNDIETCVTDLRKKYKTILTTHLSTDAISLYDIDFTDSVALVFGNEHAGVTDELRGLADGNFIIPQFGIIQSLNISVACAVSIYEAMRQKLKAGHYDQNSLPADQLAALKQEWGFDPE